MNLDDNLRDKAAINGEFPDTAALSQAIKMVFRRGKNWEMLAPEAKEALEMAATGVSMILNGDAAEPEHWNAVASYMRLRANGLSGRLESGIGRIARLRTQPRPMPPASDTPDEDGAA